MTITVSFENPATPVQLLMSSMPSTEYFVARCDSTKEREICIRTGDGAWLFTSKRGNVSWTHDSDWVDKHYTPLPNERATITISI